MDGKNIKNRYSKEFDEENIRDNIYSLINPIGKYDYFSTTKLLSWYLDLLSKGREKKLSEITILDAGCGDGRKSRIIAELIGNANSVKGFDLSEEGISYCKRINGLIECQVGNIVTAFPAYKEKFDGIISCCVFMFLKDDDEIHKALKNIYKNLKNDGLFLWFDTNEVTHSDCKEKLFWGFSPQEMDDYAEKAGFELIEQTHLFRSMKIRGNMVSSYYFVDKTGILLAEVINNVPFFRPSYNARVYKKSIIKSNNEENCSE